MPNKTVYISPDNEESWEDFKTTYGSLNSYLSNNIVRGVTSLVAHSNYTPPTPVNKEDAKGCKHGYNPMFCKYAKNGKPCK